MEPNRMVFFLPIPGGMPVSSAAVPQHLVVGPQPLSQLTAGTTVPPPFMVKTGPEEQSATKVSSHPQQPPPVQLYLCDSTQGESRDPEDDGWQPASSMTSLQQYHSALTSKKISEALSSFLPDVPGEFDTVETPDSMLRTLIDRPPIGGRDYIPLSDQSLLGFRLHPGALPEQYRLDSSSTETHYQRPKKRKRKHAKHRHTDKEETLDNYSPSSPRPHSPHIEPCSFIKPEQTTSFFQNREHPSSHHMSASMHLVSSQVGFHPSHSITGTPVISSSHTVPVIDRPHTLQSGPVMIAGTSGGSLALDPTRMIAKKKKRHQEGGEAVPRKKKKKDKDKKRKKEKRLEAPPQSVLVGPPQTMPSLVPTYPPRPPTHHPM